MVITYSKVRINRTWLQVLLVVILRWKINFSLFPFAPENLSRETGLAVPSRVSLLIPHIIISGRLNHPSLRSKVETCCTFFTGVKTFKNAGVEYGSGSFRQ